MRRLFLVWVVAVVAVLFAAPAGADSTKDNSAPQAQSSDQVASEPQRAFLYIENPSEFKGGKEYHVGSVVWHTEPNWTSGKMEIGVRADIEIPDRQLKVTLSFRRNADPTLSASQIIELTFVQSQDTTGAQIANVPGIAMNPNRRARGIPLDGLAVKMSDGAFQVRLSNVDAERERNVVLMQQFAWFDLPMVYTNQRRALLSIEKGPTGTQILNDAFAAWQQ